MQSRLMKEILAYSIIKLCYLKTAISRLTRSIFANSTVKDIPNTTISCDAIDILAVPNTVLVPETKKTAKMHCSHKNAT